MALLNAESFDLYGTSGGALLLRGYSGGSRGSPAPSTSAPRTGTYCLEFENLDYERGIRYNFDSPVDVCGTGAAIRFSNFDGAGRGEPGLCIFAGGSTSPILKILSDSDLSLRVYFNASVIGNTRPNCITTGTYYWIEIKAINDNAGGGSNSGSFELRVNGKTELIVNGLSMPAQFSATGLGTWGGTGVDTFARFDDWITWDNSGTYNNDFMGDRRCFTVFPNADTAEADWLPSSGTEGYSLIDEPTPDDAGYVEAVNPGDISEFEKQPIGIDTNDVAGVVVIARALKTDAGTSTFRAGIHSGAFVENGEEFSPNTTPAYFSTIVERDPNGDIPWTRASVDAANLVITRES